MEKSLLSESPELNAIIEKFSPFLGEVRKRVLRILIVFVIATVIGFIFYREIIAFLIDILSLKGVNIVFTSPFQFINLSISCGIATGIVVIIPLLVAQIMAFLKPALNKLEYTTAARLLPLSFLLFLTGFTLGAIIMKWQIEIFLDRSISLGIGNVLDISRLLTTVILTSVLMGAGFQFPFILLLLMRFGVLSYQSLSHKRSWIYLGSFVFALFLPPDSILADVFLSLPLILLFELTLFIWRLQKRKNRPEAVS